MDQRVAAVEVSANKKRTEYWGFIDGLRAIAVLSVVLYHAGVPRLSGGYVGVDIFFVISGYLIINQIATGLRKGRFSFSEFWSRRALRILPPYLLVIVTCAIIAPFVLVMPGEYEDFAREVAYSAMMAANHLFLSQQGYFDQASDTKVLLHLWSLAVEEQFYVAVPLIMAAAWLLRKSVLIGFALVAFMLSLAGCIYWTGLEGDKNYSFFLMPLRAWEFIAGGAAGAVVPYVSRLPRLAVEALAAAGIAAIGLSVFLFTHGTPFPSFWAIIPVFGSCAIIASGLAGPNIVKSALSTRPMVAVGLISYSWYLWHWPLLAFGRIYNFGSHVPSVDAAMAALSFLLSVGTYFAVERPIRKWREIRGRPLRWTPAILGVTACVAFSLAGYTLFTGKAQSLDQQLAGTMLPGQIGGGTCDLRTVTTPEACDHDYDSLGVLIGDSQAGSATKGILRLANNHGAALATISSGGCISFLFSENRIRDSRMAKNCETGRTNAKLVLPALKPSFAILYSRWSMYTMPRGYAFLDPDGKESSDQRQRFLDEFDSTISYLRENGIGRILVIGPTPTFPRNSPECVIRSDHYGIPRDQMCSQPVSKEMSLRQKGITWLNEGASKHDDVVIIDPLSTFCDDDYCRPYHDNLALFRDNNHITDAGVELIAQKFSSEFKWVTGID